MLQAIYQGLDELPGKLGREVMQAIMAQVQQQLDMANATDQLNAQRAKKAMELLEAAEKAPPP